MNPRAVEYTTIGWERLHRDACALARMLEQGPPFQGIVAVSRGGLVPAAIIARELDCRLIETISVITYAGEAGTRGSSRVIKPASAAGDGTGYVIIDDLVDSGQTATLVRQLLPKSRFACLYAKPAGAAVADCYIAQFPQNSWITFPWDVTPLG